MDEVLQEIEKHVKQGDTIVDLMSGTGSVARALRDEDYVVIAADLMTYSYFHNVVGLKIDSVPDFNGLSTEIGYRDNVCGGHYTQVLQYLNNLEPVKGYYFNEFSPEGHPKLVKKARHYFSNENSQLIDAIVLKLNDWRDTAKTTKMENALLRHSLILSINDIANVSGTYGHYHAKQVKKSEDRLIIKASLEESIFLNTRSKDHVVLQGYAEELAKDIKADLCYIDPPYTKRQYAANYHILETVARGDFPDAIGASGLRPWRDQYSNFNSKVKIRDSFRKIIQDMECDIFIVSYSEDGLLTKEELTELMEEFGEVSFRAFSHKRFKSNDSKLSKNLSEYLFTLKRTN